MWRVLACIFSFSLLIKGLVTGFDRFVVYVSRALVLPTMLAEFVAAAVLIGECATVCLLIWPRSRTIGLAFGGVLMTAFFVFHSISFVLGDIEPCPCFGPRILPGGRLGHALMMLLSGWFTWRIGRSLARPPALAANFQDGVTC